MSSFLKKETQCVCKSILNALVHNACLTLFTALFNAVCLHNAHFLPMTFANAFGFHALSWVIDT